MTSDTRPNVLLIVTDQQRGDMLGCAGYPVRTPNIDALAESGVRYRNGFTTHPTCTPSRSTMLTGRYPSSHGARMTGMILRETEVTLPTVLSAAGYETASFGKLHLAPFGPSPDENCPSRELHWLWDDADEPPIAGDYYGFQKVAFAGGHGNGVWGGYRDWLRERGALERLRERPPQYPDGSSDMFPYPLPAELHHSTWLGEITEDYLREPSDRPFFAMVSFPDPHHPFCPPAEYAGRYDPADMPAPIPADDDDFADWPPHYHRAFHGEIERYSGGGTIDLSSLPAALFRRGRALTAAMIELIDNAVGRITAALDDTGLRENTVVIYCADHGDFLGDHGFMYKGPFHWNGLLNVPYVWSHPGNICPRDIEGEVGSTIDIAPTVLDMCGVEQPDGVEGGLDSRLPPRCRPESAHRGIDRE